MGFAAVARVTESRWVACSVMDQIDFGLKPGGELTVETTICHQIRQTREPVIIDHVAEDQDYCNHPTPLQYGFQSYISMPILLEDKRFFGTLCAIDPQPARLNRPEVIQMFRLFADLIAFHIDAVERVQKSESSLQAEHEVSQLREQFIAVLGHDLRSPLSAISSGTEILSEIVAEKNASQIVGMMRESAVRMAGMIEDVMDFARGRLGGGIELELADGPLEEVLRQVIEETQASWPNRQIEARISLPATLRYDRRRIGQLFSNLLGNAMKHGNASAPVRVTAEVETERLELTISNAAEPIPESKLSRLFHPFSRGKSGNYQEGLGLGLYIASEIAKAHGGLLSVESTPEQTRFTFVMPG